MPNQSRSLMLAAAFLAGTSLSALAQTNAPMGEGLGTLGPTAPGMTGNGMNYLNGDGPGSGSQHSNDADGGIRTAAARQQFQR